jgi:4-amino-4-deoxy-L-arabinose transferase-like glycosyltransferase
MFPSYRHLIYPALLLLLCSLLYFPYLGSAPFFDKGEPREAMAVQDIVQRGDWLVPLKRAIDVPSKPPLFHWAAAAVSQVTGKLNETTMRMPSAVFATLGVLLLYFFARTVFTPDVGVLAGTILATTMVYQYQALDARVDMTLCFFVMVSLTLFYLLHRDLLHHPAWYYVFFVVTGIGTLAKGPLGVLLPLSVAGVFVLIKRRWDIMRRFCFHPGVVLMFVLAGGWYVVAVMRGGEGFFERQIVQENLSRFFGGSGHNHPVYYYLPYLLVQGLPWGLLLPVVLWDAFKNGSTHDDDALFLKVWFVAMFVFFSISIGKRSVYLLPLYPALSALTARWILTYDGVIGARLYYYRAVAVLTALIGLALLLIVIGQLWIDNPAMLLGPVEALLKPKDLANFKFVASELAVFGTRFAFATILSVLLWFSLATRLWSGRLRSSVPRFVLIALVACYMARAIVVPAIAETKSYRRFMLEVNRIVGRDDPLYLYRSSFNSDQVIFYRGRPVEILHAGPDRMGSQLGGENAYVILTEREWLALKKLRQDLPEPLLRSAGVGPEGEDRLVLTRVRHLS